MPLKRLFTILCANKYRAVFSAVAAAALVLLWMGTSRAADGRDFAGSYAVTAVAAEGAGLRISLTVQVQNYGDANIANAVIALEEFTPSGKPYGSFPSITALAVNERAEVSAQLLVSPEEYERWQNGGTPVFSIEFDDGQGGKTRRPVEVTSLSVGGQS